MNSSECIKFEMHAIVYNLAVIGMFFHTKEKVKTKKKKEKKKELAIINEKRHVE